jgi:hypothetical protein
MTAALLRPTPGVLYALVERLGGGGFKWRTIKMGG